jgi:hypothetical protein
LQQRARRVVGSRMRPGHGGELASGVLAMTQEADVTSTSG